MGLSNFCRCLFCCYNKRQREIEIIYQKIKNQQDILETVI